MIAQLGGRDLFNCAHRARRDDDRLLRAVSLGAVVSAASALNYVLFPSRFTELLYSGDLLFVFAAGIVLDGAIREVTSNEAALVRSAVSSERQRMASELQAGVAQELALMAAYSDWITRQPPEERRLDMLSASVERALDESRGAIAALAPRSTSRWSRLWRTPPGMSPPAWASRWRSSWTSRRR